MGGLRGGRGGGGGGGFDEESDSFEAMDDARSLSDGCEDFLGGGGGGGLESVGCCVIASMVSLWRGVPRLAMSYVAPRAATPMLSEASALFSSRRLLGDLACDTVRTSRAVGVVRCVRCAQRPVDAAVGLFFPAAC